MVSAKNSENLEDCLIEIVFDNLSIEISCEDFYKLRTLVYCDYINSIFPNYVPILN